MLENSPIYDLYVNPTYAVCLPQRERGRRGKTAEQVRNEQNLTKNSHAGHMSPKAIRRLTNAINWLVASAPSKWVYDKTTKKRYNFKVNFVTLTLPTIDHGITDHIFKKELLHNFINTCRYKFGMKNFVWKVETQANGNIHAHFTTDTFIHWKDLRHVWNRILEKKGIIDKYTQKHNKLTFDEYNNLYNPAGKKDIEQVRKSFLYGTTTNWRDPNSTDVHSVWNVKDLAAYLAKYMGKKEEDRRPISGRLWGCSYNLSAENKLVIELCGTDVSKYLEPLFSPCIKYKPIELLSKLNNTVFQIGEIFFYSLADWGTNIKGALLEKYNEHRFGIRQNLDMKALRSIKIAHVEPPPPIEFDLAFIDEYAGKELPF